MENDNHSGEQDQLEEHSLPGTNQAGKGAISGETNDSNSDACSERRTRG
jgi:hypothetical protein